MAIPKEPRQLMINLMYLVLTAMLAINVSNEILRAFKVINKSINRSNNNIALKNQGTIENFNESLKDKKVLEDPPKKARIEEALQRALKVREKADAMVQQILGYKYEIVKTSGGMVAPKAGSGETDSTYFKEDDLDAATKIMVEGKKKGTELKKGLELFKKEIAELSIKKSDSTIGLINMLVDSVLPISFQDFKKISGNDDEDWSYANFHMVPTIGAVTILDKYVNDVRNSENIILDQIWADAFGEKVKPPKVIQIVNKFALIAAPENTYLLPGQKFKTTLSIGSYNSGNNSSVNISVNGVSRPIVDGVATYEETAPTTAGERTLNITGSIYDPNIKGNTSCNPLAIKYFVGNPSASISLDKMNVFYIGVDNPITMSASGIPLDKLKLEATPNITYTSVGPGKYVVRVTGANNSKGSLKLSGARSDGSMQDYGTKEYRIKSVPPPKLFFAKKDQSGPLAANLAKLYLGPEAILENFDFDFKYSVTNFKLVIVRGGEVVYEGYSGGPYFKSSASMVKAVESMKAKDNIYIEEVEVMGDDKIRKKINGLTFRLLKS